MEILLLLFLTLSCIGKTFAQGTCHEKLASVPKRLVGTYIPQCKSDGTFKEKQCHASTGYCWCVKSQNGVEIKGTRKGPAEEVICNELSCGLPGLFFTNKTSILCMPINTSTGFLVGNTPHKLVNSTGLIRTLGLDPVKRNVYWGDLKYNTINKVSLDGGEPIILFSYAIGYVQGLAVDWTSNILYWTDSLMKLIELSDTTGFNRKVMFKLHGDTEPRGIFVDPTNGYLFWTDWGSQPKIERSSLSGANRKTIVSSSIKWPNDLALDHVTSRIFWIDAYHDVVESVTLDGALRQKVYKMSYKYPHPYSMAHATGLNITYWTDWLINSIFAASTERFGTISKIVYHKDYKYKSIGQVRVLEDFSDSTDSTACLSKQQNKCSHLCLKASKDQHVCDCPTGMLLQNTSTTTCQHAERSYEIYFADSHEKSVNHLIKYDGQEGFTIRPLIIPINEMMKYPVALDYDPYEGYIYWTDHGNLKTYRMHENGSNIKVILKSKEKPSSGIAVHKVSKVIFYFSMVDQQKQISLMMSCLHGHFQKTILKGKFHRPRDIAIYEDDSLIFFTDQNCVGRVYMDGTGFRCLRGKKGLTMYPVGLAIDNVEKRLYWCDHVYYSITSIGFNLNQRSIHLIIQKTFFHRFRFWLVVNRGFVVKPYSMAILGEKVFWTDLQKQAIFSADKRGGSNIEYVTGGLGQPKDLHVYSDKVLTEYRKVYKLSFFVKRNDRRAAYCRRTSSYCSSKLTFPDPAPCPSGYHQTRYEGACANCSDAFGGNFKCICNDWKTCAQRAYGKVKGCPPFQPYMMFKVRECVQTVKPGVCSYKTLSTCPEATVCLSDNDCHGNMKCCETNCGKKCTLPVQREDHPCTVNKGGCSHFCISKLNGYQCFCPDGMRIDNDGKMCVHMNNGSMSSDLCMLPPHVGSCHSHKPLERWYYNATSKLCEQFHWGGCGKNQNNFLAKEHCNKVCTKFMDCNEQKKVGPCRGAITRWYYQPEVKRCQTFIWGGCDAGTNNFKSEKECTKECKRERRETCMCQHGGTCSIQEDGYSTQCHCTVHWFGEACNLNSEKGAVTVTFGRFQQLKFTKEELKKDVASMLRTYCHISQCKFVNATSRKRRKHRKPRSMEEFEFTADNILIQNYTVDERSVIVTFIVLQPGSHTSILTTTSLQRSFNSTIGQAVGRQFGIKVTRTVSATRMGWKRPYRRDSTPAIVLTLIFAAIVVAIAGYVYYRKKEMQRPSVSPRDQLPRGSPRDHLPAVDNNYNIVQRARNNCSTLLTSFLKNVRSSAPSKDRLPTVANDSNIAHSSFENELYDDVYPANVVLPHPVINEEPIQSFANPAYVSRPVAASRDSPTYDDMVASPNIANLQGGGVIPEKRKIDDWVQFTDDGVKVTGPRFNDGITGIDIQISDPYNIVDDPPVDGPPPDYSSEPSTEFRVPEPGYDDLPRYSQITVRELADRQRAESPAVEVHADQRHVQFAIIDSTEAAASSSEDHVTII